MKTYPSRLIGFLNFIQFPHRPEQHVSHYRFQEIISKSYDIDPLSLTFIEFKKKKYKTPNDVKTKLDKWIYFFQNSNTQTIDQLLKFVGKDETFEKAYYQLEYNSYTPAERKALDEAVDALSTRKGEINQARIDGREEGRMEGREEGRMDGLREAKVEAALNALKLGLSVDVAAKISGLTEEDVLKLKL